MKFFFDESFPFRLAQVIAYLSQEEDQKHTLVLPGTSKTYPKKTPDIDWITGLSQEGDWIILSGDSRIRRHPLLRPAFDATNLILFYLADAWPNKKIWEQAQTFIIWWPEIVEASARFPRPHIGKIPWTKGGPNWKKLGREV